MTLLLFLQNLSPALKDYGHGNDNRSQYGDDVGYLSVEENLQQEQCITMDVRLHKSTVYE